MSNNNNTLSESVLSTKQKLLFLWIFAVANYIFCDFSELLQAAERERALGFAIVMQLPIMMIPLSVFLPYKSNRIANITIGLLMTGTIGLLMTIFLGLTQFGDKFLRYIFLTLFGENTLHFIFFSIIEIATTLAIIWISFNWSEREI